MLLPQPSDASSDTFNISDMQTPKAEITSKSRRALNFESDYKQDAQRLPSDAYILSRVFEVHRSDSVHVLHCLMVYP